MKREWLWLTLIYCLAHLPLLATTGQCYDDWALFLVDSKLNVELWTATGRPLTGQFLNILRDLGGVFLARAFTFLAYLLAGLLLAEILRSIRIIDPAGRFLVTAFFMVFPADATRELPMLAYDSLCYFLFFFAFWLLSRYMGSRMIALRIGALCAFFLSFWLNSLLVMYLLVALYVVYLEWKEPFTLRWCLSLSRRYADFLCLPFIFWIIQRLIYPPFGENEGYNRFTLAGLSPKRWMLAFKGAFFDPAVYSVLPVDAFQLCAIVLGAALLYLFWKKDLSCQTSAPGTDAALLATGALAAFLALLPYVAVGKVPVYWDWASRHARLVPLAAGLILFYGLRILARQVKARSAGILATYCLLLCVFITGNIRIYGEFWIDWYKALSMVREFKSSDVIRGHTSFLFSDETEHLNARNRWLRFYEYAALMNEAFGDTKRFGHDENHWTGNSGLEELAKLVRGDRSPTPVVNHAAAYRLSDWTPQEPQFRITIRSSGKDLSKYDLLRFKYLELFDRPAFDGNPPDLVRLTAERIDLH